MVRENRVKYNILNIVVILITAAMFIFNYRKISEVFQNTMPTQILMLIIAVVLVNVIKVGRLYLAL